MGEVSGGKAEVHSGMFSFGVVRGAFPPKQAR